MKVLFLQTAHNADDDRVHFHQRLSLESAGHTCFFAVRTAEVTERPDVVICDTPKAVIYARKHLGHVCIIYDITEWYPSKKNLRNVSLFIKPFKFCALVLLSLCAGFVADKFIFGEYYKAKPFRLLFFWKKYIILPYYPSLEFIMPSEPHALLHEIRLLYAGPSTQEKGFGRVNRLVNLCQQKMPDVHVILTTVNGLSYEAFCKEITRHDIFLDLRDTDYENTRCLPIKLFYYMAAGRPVIYSDLKAIRHDVPEIVRDSLVTPDNLEQAADIVCKYVSQPDYYKWMCARNRQLAEQRYNWESQRNTFIQFIEA